MASPTSCAGSTDDRDDGERRSATSRSTPSSPATQAKPGHVLQLCFYAEAIEASTGVLPEWVHIELGSGRSEAVRVADVLPYWRRLRGQLAKLLTEGVEADTRPKPCDHCQFCEFELVCEAAWRAADSLVHVAGVRAADRLTLQQDRVTTIAALAELDREVAGIDPARRVTLVRQARLQVQARNAPDDKPPFELLAAPSDADHAPLVDDLDAPDPIGFAALPAPDDGDVFLDFEGHPFWHADAELFFLFGLIERSPAGEWEFTAFWAHDKAEEAVATKALVDHLAARRAQFPDMHVYHYNHTERSSLERLVKEHGVAELALEQLITTGLFVDLLPIVTGGDAGRRRGLRPQARRAAHRLRARPRDRPGFRRRRGVRAVDGVARPGRPRSDRGVQRGRRARHPGAARLAGRRNVPPACRGGRRCSGRKNRMPRSTSASRRSMRSARARSST